MMKAPKYEAATAQAQSDMRINPFAVALVAESFAEDRSSFCDETVMVVGYSHKRTPVYMLLSTEEPEENQFITWPITGDQMSVRQNFRAKLVKILAHHYHDQISISAVEDVLDAFGLKDEE